MTTVEISASELNLSFSTVAEEWVFEGEEAAPRDRERYRLYASVVAERLLDRGRAKEHLLGFRAVLNRPDILQGYDWGSAEGDWDWQYDVELTRAVMEVIVEELDKVVPDDAIEYPVSVTVTDGPGPVLDAPL